MCTFAQNEAFICVLLQKKCAEIASREASFPSIRSAMK